MENQMNIMVPSEIYGYESGVLLDFMDCICINESVRVKTAYNYYLVGRTLAKYLFKRRFHLDAPVDEVTLPSLSADVFTSITSEEWDGFLSYCEHVRYSRRRTHVFRLVACRRLYKWIEQTTGVRAPRFVMDARAPGLSDGAREHIDVVSDSTVRKILAKVGGECQQRNVCIISLVAYCGLGVNEIIALQLEDLSLESIRIQGENGRVRTVSLNETTKRELDRYLLVRIPPIDGKNPLFVSKKCGPLTRSAIYKMFSKAVSKANLDRPVTLQDLQQTWGHMVARKGYRTILECGRATSRWYIEKKYGLAQ